MQTLKVWAMGVALLFSGSLDAQSPKPVDQGPQPAPPLAFAVSSVRLDRSDTPAKANISLGTGDNFTPTGGLFTAVNYSLSAYISFAYRITSSQAVSFWPQLPQWAKDEHYDIQARAEGNPGKDDFRAMMRALLADRFKLAIHTENREIPLFYLVVDTPGKTGPDLRPHPANSPCPAAAATNDQFPPNCGVVTKQSPSAPNHLRMGGRDVAIQSIVDAFPTLDLGRPVLDSTGLKDHVDFTLDWAPDSRDQQEPGLAGVPDPTGPSFFEALKQQMGLKLKPQKGEFGMMIVDHIEHPSEN